MLIGEYTAKVGAKKRVSLPTKFREELGDEIILTRGYEDALIVVNKKLWKKIGSEVINGSFINKNIRDTSRFLVGGARELQLDSQGRFVIPQTLFEHAQLSDEVIFIGLANWVEIWDKQKWEERLKYLKENSDKIAQEIAKINTDDNG
ncbi:MAG: division/cell wall cluster transcriptional repressor MraZ [Candidatus Dojkabacteria bacterium]|jgi:MraZ protein|nr:division/cell wall cluster transcriptional repressor MraZ [Candidatus Dojkabacteria bacterium]MDD2270022.1 division/cell wall cluster transcriptional repressor MraZ [Candidatus Dojkabacteria bacterium]